MWDVARAWVEGWAVARGVAVPVAEPWGLRVEVGTPGQVRRHVLLDADAATARALVAGVTEPTTCVKGFLEQAEMGAWFPAEHWEPVESCFLMAVELRPEPVRVPDGYRVTVERAGDGSGDGTGPGGPLTARITTVDGAPAAAGVAGPTAGGACVFDQIVTEPAHRRRGLGTVVMGALSEAAGRGGATTGVLGATVPGRALYETLGWKVLAPLNGYAYRG
ncbi:GNAT family N-acetyltransferase [Streptomyces sp. NPDC097619]|uniref:GNAT family N-acetyltransferase n=1 Tax=Streptomyces sp. NPDC097619 TaxID=3157228 RepID=UPI003322A3C0